MWVTADGFIRQELLPNGRYDEARGNRQSAYTGSYTVTGNHLDYVDDTGFTATGDIRDGVLYHEHLVLYREGEQPTREASAVLDLFWGHRRKLMSHETHRGLEKDGFRALVSADAGKVALRSRRGTDMGPAFPEIVAGAGQLPDATALDGVM
jgi:hypothetical protein